MQLSTYLKKNKLTPTEFARQIGISKSFACRLAKGELLPNPTFALKIKDFTGGKVRPVDFFDPPSRRPKKATASPVAETATECQGLPPSDGDANASPSDNLG